MVSKLKQGIAEKYGFYLLLIPLVAMVTLNDSKLVVNIYRVWICLPLLFLARKQDVFSFVRHPFVKRYLLLTLFCYLSLLWSEADSVRNMAVKMLAMTVFLFLTYIVSAYQVKKYVALDSAYITLGLTLLAFYLLAYLGHPIPADDVYGVFGNKNELAWVVATVSLIAGYKLVNEGFNPYLLGILLVLLAVLWGLASRASLMAFYVGMLLVFLTDKRRWMTLTCVGVMLVLPLILYSVSGEQAVSLVDRADSGRFFIYQNALDKITSSVQIFLIGHGMAADSENLSSSGLIMGHWHSIYISMLFYGGIIGFALFMYCFFYRFWLLLRKKATMCVWDVVVFGMGIALLFDGNRVFNYPSGIFMVFVLPVFFANLQDNIKDPIDSIK